MRAIFAAIALAIVVALGNTQNLPAPGDCGITSIPPKPVSRIVNGEAATPHSRPYQLLLIGFFPNGTAKFYCGASLITPAHALTAAHCVAGNDAKDIRLYPGIHEFTSDLLTTSAGIPAKAFIQHKSYNNRTLTYDIAVIRLQKLVEIDTIRTALICIPTETASCAVGTPVVASGWGAFTSAKNITGPSRPVELHQVGLQCVTGDSNADCRKLTYTLSFFKDNSKMCAYAPNKGVCFGDSGGPLVRERTTAGGTKYFEQVGIMSGTIDCSLSKPQPDVYADVPFFSKWIREQVTALT